MSSDRGKADSGLWSQLKFGLSRSSRTLLGNLEPLMTRRRLDLSVVGELEELLIASDLGAAVAHRIALALTERLVATDIAPDVVRSILAQAIATELASAQVAINWNAAKPFVLLVVGANGTGKTTTIGKIADLLRRDGRSVLLAACDTFRAAAIEQLQVWGDRADAAVLVREPGADAAALAFDAVAQASRDETEVVLIDTAGRLQNKDSLMAELAKIERVLQKCDDKAPHGVLLVLDATTGQNARNQVAAFQSICHVTGLVMTKLDGTARGGMLVALTAEFGLPVHYIGVGESSRDLHPFDPIAFSRALVGIDS